MDQRTVENEDPDDHVMGRQNRGYARQYEERGQRGCQRRLNGDRPQPAEAALVNIRHMALCLNVLAAQDGPRKSDAHRIPYGVMHQHSTVVKLLQLRRLPARSHHRQLQVPHLLAERVAVDAQQLRGADLVALAAAAAAPINGPSISRRIRW